MYGPVFTCLRPDLVKGKLFMLPLNSLLERSRAGNSHNNPHNGSARPAKMLPGTREEANQCAFEQLEEDFKPGNFVQGSMKGTFHEKV